MLPKPLNPMSSLLPLEGRASPYDAYRLSLPPSKPTILSVRWALLATMPPLVRMSRPMNRLYRLRRSK